MKLTRRQTRLIQILAIPVSVLAAIMGGSIIYGTFTLFIASQFYYIYSLQDKD